MRREERDRRTRELAAALVRTERAAGGECRLAPYLRDWRGAAFDAAVNGEHPWSVTLRDMEALRHLGVRVTAEGRDRLLEPGTASRVAGLLEQVSPDLALEDLDGDEYQALLAPRSPAAELWDVVYAQVRDAPARAGRQVTAGKLLHAKRPGLLPIYDSRMRRSLAVSVRSSWRGVWWALRDGEVRDGLEQLRAEVPGAGGLSLVRVLDIVAWMDAGVLRKERAGAPVTDRLMG